MLKKLRLSTFGAAYRMGGYIGWYLTVMYISERSLHYYRDDSMLAEVNITFLTASVISCAVLVAVLLLLDFEGLLSDKLLRWLPGAFMAESGVALSLANASTMRVFAAIAGVASAFGLLAVMSRLLKVKVGQRAMSIGLALALGGAVRFLAGIALNGAGQIGLVVISVIVGAIALLTVHSDGFSRTDGPLVSLPEADPMRILAKLPKAYIMMFLCASAYYFSQSYTETLAKGLLPSGYAGFYYFAYAGFLVSGLAVALFVKVTMLPMLAVFAAALSASAALLAGLPYFSVVDASLYALLAYSGLACFKAAIFIFIIIFSLDRPHPLFYAVFGASVASAAELCGAYLSQRLALTGLHVPELLLVLLMPIVGIFIYRAMESNGFTKDQLAKRHLVSDLIKRSAAELELSERQRKMTELIVLDGSDVEELALKLLFSRNTIRVLLRPLFAKYEVNGTVALREHFDSLARREEDFLEQVRAAEEEKRAQDEMQKLRESYEQRQKRIAELTARHEKKAELAASVAVDAQLEEEPEDIDAAPASDESEDVDARGFE